MFTNTKPMTPPSVEINAHKVRSDFQLEMRFDPARSDETVYLFMFRFHAASRDTQCISVKHGYIFQATDQHVMFPGSLLLARFFVHLIKQTIDICNEANPELEIVSPDGDELCSMIVKCMYAGLN